MSFLSECKEMSYFQLRNMKDAAAALREVASFLERIEVPATREPSSGKQLPKKGGKKDEPPVDIIALAESIRSLPRPQLVDTLSGLSAATLRSLCYHIGLKGISKRPKDEVIQAIVRELVDFAEEHRRLKTFSQRRIEELGSTN